MVGVREPSAFVFCQLVTCFDLLRLNFARGSPTVSECCTKRFVKLVLPIGERSSHRFPGTGRVDVDRTWAPAYGHVVRYPDFASGFAGRRRSVSAVFLPATADLLMRLFHVKLRRSVAWRGRCSDGDFEGVSRAAGSHLTWCIHNGRRGAGCPKDPTLRRGHLFSYECISIALASRIRLARAQFRPVQPERYPVAWRSSSCQTRRIG